MLYKAFSWISDASTAHTHTHTRTTHSSRYPRQCNVAMRQKRSHCCPLSGGMPVRSSRANVYQYCISSGWPPPRRNMTLAAQRCAQSVTAEHLPLITCYQPTRFQVDGEWGIKCVVWLSTIKDGLVLALRLNHIFWCNPWALLQPIGFVARSVVSAIDDDLGLISSRPWDDSLIGW